MLCKRVNMVSVCNCSLCMPQELCVNEQGMKHIYVETIRGRKTSLGRRTMSYFVLVRECGLVLWGTCIKCSKVSFLTVAVTCSVENTQDVCVPSLLEVGKIRIFWPFEKWWAYVQRLCVYFARLRKILHILRYDIISVYLYVKSSYILVVQNKETTWISLFGI